MMASAFRFFWWADLIKAGISHLSGSAETPVKEVSTPGLIIQSEQAVTIAPGETATLWIYTDTNGESETLREWTGAAFQIDGGEGFLWLTITKGAMDEETHLPVDMETDTDEFSVGLSCHMPQTFSSMAAMYSGEEGRIYKVRATNPSETDDVTVRKHIWG